MPETIIPSKRHQRIWVLNPDQFGKRVVLVDVIAWAINGDRQPIPITPFGKCDVSKEYVLGGEAGWIAFPSGQAFDHSGAVQTFLEAQRDQG
jgi:hypothetical protein